MVKVNTSSTYHLQRHGFESTGGAETVQMPVAIYMDELKTHKSGSIYISLFKKNLSLTTTVGVK